MLRDKVANLPDAPGVYLWRGADGEVLYVGKALSLQKRVRSYLQGNLPPKTAALMEAARDVEVITTGSEVEALILEANLIKRHRPRYNVLLKDDKAYPYLKLTAGPFPRLLVVRAQVPDGSRYFGPFPRSGAVQETLRVLGAIFPLRRCGDEKLRRAERPCLDYHIKRCLAPCRGLVSEEDYGRLVREVELFLEGRTKHLVRRLERDMRRAAAELRFEEASRLRDRLAALRRVTEEQRVVGGGGDFDVLGLAVSSAGAVGQIFLVRDGRLVGRESLELTGTDERSEPEILAAFLELYYLQAAVVPPEILLPLPLPETDLLIRWLSGRRGGRVSLRVPRRGKKWGLLAMAEENARLALAELERSRTRGAEDESEALRGLADLLGLSEPPRRLEGMDISHLGGTETVGSVVAFRGGRPDKDGYRRFRLGTGGGDDYAALAEVARRRFSRAARGDAGWETPDLLLVDGGPGQLSAVAGVLEEIGIRVPVISLAKAEEQIFLPGRGEPVILSRRHPSLRLLQRVRDEAHRFAVTYQRQRRGRRSLGSVLDEVPGIGPRRKQALLKAFGSLRGLRTASVEELKRAGRLDEATARRLKEHLG